jgi:hypothetical protein
MVRATVMAVISTQPGHVTPFAPEPREPPEDGPVEPRHVGSFDQPGELGQ